MKNQRKLAVLCCAVYFVSYITRINYAAVLTEIISDLQISKSVASIAVTGSFITYGVGQILSGIIGDKFKPQNVILCGLVGTSIINLSVAFLPDIQIINAVWCLNGFFQAMMWPPLVRIAAENFEGKSYTVLIGRISQASYAATIAIYALVPLIITVSEWQTVFAVTGLIGAVFGIIWFFETRNLKNAAVSENDKEIKGRLPVSVLLKAGIIPIFIAIVLQGVLRDGITTWAPTYITEVFSLDTSVSILTSAILPLFSIISVSLVVKIALKFKNELKSSFEFYIASFAVTLALTFFSSKLVAFDIAAMAIAISCMHGINNMLVGNVPYYFSRFGKISTVSGIINSATYVGSAISTYAFAAVSDNLGWGFTVGSWVVISAIGAVLCFSCINRWKCFAESE